MAWNTQVRTLEVVSNAFPQHYGQDILEAMRLKGVEKLGRLYHYIVEVQSAELNGLYVSEVLQMVDVNSLVGKRMTVKIAIEGSGSDSDGGINVGAGVREITGVIAGMECTGSDRRRAYYRIRLRPLLWLATLNRENRTFRDKTVREITDEILKPYLFMVRWKLLGALNGTRPYPKRDYQRQFWQSDFSYLDQLWQEWGITFYFEGATLVLTDNAGYPGHGPAYRTVRFLNEGGQRIDEEHIHKLEYSRELTTGKVAVIDYDYTQGTNKLYGRTVSNYRDAANDNAEEYMAADYAQPKQGAMGLNAQPNDYDFEARHLAQVRVDAHRNKSLTIKAEGNLRGIMTGHKLTATDHPCRAVNQKYIVTGTKIEIVNNDSVTQGGVVQRQYTCRTKFTAVPSRHYYRTPLKAKKPRAFAEKAIVTGHEGVKVTTDRMARIRIWFIWDRDHKRDEEASCWVPLMQVWQGARYGGMWIPRKGDHVYIGYLNSDPDRPFILGSHVTDSSEAPWDLYANHALSGWRSQDLGGHSGGSNAVVTDDTPGKLQVQVTSDHANSRFIAGYNVRIDGDKGRQQARGEGVEIATDSYGVGRANRGWLLTTETRAGATAPVKDMGETVQRLTQARQQHEDLSLLAGKHKAQTPDASQGDAASTIKAQNDAIKGGTKSNSNPSPEMTRPDVVIASAAGIATTATDSTHMASVHDHAITTGRDVSVSSGRSFLASVRGAITMFAYQLGLKLIAARGKVIMQAQSDEMLLAALKDVKISSTDGRIVITASKEIWLGAGGSYIQITGSGIINGSPGPILEKTPKWDKPPADSKRMPLPDLPGDKIHSAQFVVRDRSGTPIPNYAYRLEAENGPTWHGVTDEHGNTERVWMASPQNVTLHPHHVEHADDSDADGSDCCDIAPNNKGN